VLGVSPEWAEENPETLARLVVALDNAARWCDRREHHVALADMLSDPAYVGVPSDLILRLLSGSLTVDPDGTTRQLDTYFAFHDQAANFPWISQALWVYSQMVRWGQVAHDKANLARVRAACRPDIYRAVLSGSDTPVPLIDSRSEGAEVGPSTVPTTRGDLLLGRQGFIDGRGFFPDDIEGYVAGFPIRTE
jgi:NitT/TauT family transport system ATP-binding protein